MTLLDTNVLIYAADPASPFHSWARNVISDAVADEGAAINAVTLAEFCVGDLKPDTVPDRIRSWGIAVLDLPAAAAPLCAKAYRTYRRRRETESGQSSPLVPLPDFFIGSHAAIMDWPLATADRGRFAQYFPSVSLLMPKL